MSVLKRLSLYGVIIVATVGPYYCCSYLPRARALDAAHALQGTLESRIADDARFSDVRLVVMTVPSLAAIGTVRTQADLDALRAIIPEPSTEQFRVDFFVRVEGAASATQAND